jgi:hypothetical protein
MSAAKIGLGLLFVSAVLLLLPAASIAVGPAHYLPQPDDRFAYSETVFVTNGTGNYTGYSDAGYYNGSISVSAVAPNGTASASYQASGRYENSLGANYPWSESGTFSFSGTTFRYVNGTDNQTGYVDPTVWFFMNASLARGSSFESLNTPMNVVAVNASLPYSPSPTGAVATIFAEGNGTYQRNDDYGRFTADYNWREYFDIRTGYIVKYVYTETDSDGAGDGFTYTDTLVDTSTSFPLTNVASGSSSSSSSSGSSLSTLLLIAVVVIVVVVIVVVVVLLARRRPRRAPLPRHPSGPGAGAMPTYGAPPPVHLIPGDQPAVQQVVIRETVKVPCRYCGTLMDSTATVCPKCGAPRT